MVHTYVVIYSVFKSFEDNMAPEWQQALTAQMAKSSNLIFIWLKYPVIKLNIRGQAKKSTYS